MSVELKAAADAILNGVVTSDPGVPGVVAMVTDRDRNIYEGAAGKRRLGEIAGDDVALVRPARAQLEYHLAALQDKGIVVPRGQGADDGLEAA